MLFYRAALPLSHQTLTFVSSIIRTHRKQLGLMWRKLNPGQQAMAVLVYLRKGEPFAEVGAGFDISTTTCWRYVNETVELLAARAPKLHPDPDRPPRRRPGPSVESARSAVPVLPPARFSVPLAEPGVRLSPHRALHGLCRWDVVEVGPGVGDRVASVAVAVAVAGDRDRLRGE